ncbi:MAG: hybrid-cluster NAD(P)-dependent oxidoreductase [Marinomonas sp.]
MSASSTMPLAEHWCDSELLECVSIVSETPTTSSFTFKAPSGASFNYKPGQFLTLEIPVEDGVVYRTYTISSSPTRPYLLTLTVKVHENSVGTRWMMDCLEPGMLLKVIGPAGEFTNSDSKAKKFAFISAGSGITPMMSMLTAMQDAGCELDVVFIHSARTVDEIIFRQHLSDIASQCSGLDLHFVVSQPNVSKAWGGYQGRINSIMLQAMAPDLLEREVYCCGPEAFMASVKAMLKESDYDMENYNEESFSAPTETKLPKADLTAVDDKKAYEVYFAKSDLSYCSNQGESILLAARSAGIIIPSACAFGLCGTCKVKKLEGRVDMTHNGGISQREIDDGYILACCSYPLGDVFIDS